MCYCLVKDIHVQTWMADSNWFYMCLLLKYPSVGIEKNNGSLVPQYLFKNVKALVTLFKTAYKRSLFSAAQI